MNTGFGIYLVIGLFLLAVIVIVAITQFVPPEVVTQLVAL